MFLGVIQENKRECFANKLYFILNTAVFCLAVFSASRDRVTLRERKENFIIRVICLLSDVIYGQIDASLKL